MSDDQHSDKTIEAGATAPKNLMELFAPLRGMFTDEEVDQLFSRKREHVLSEIETANADELIRQRDRSERQFASGDVVAWDEVKHRRNL